MWSLNLWKRFMCSKGYHAFDEVLSVEHVLSCDACGLSVGIKRIETEEQVCKRWEKYNNGT